LHLWWFCLLEGNLNFNFRCNKNASASWPGGGGAILGLLLGVVTICQTDNPEKCNLCTTAFFEGQAAIMDPRESWTAKWLRVDSYLPGVYAISVTGQFNRDIEEELENRGCRWRCRAAQN
jgi:hypothetical protein